MLGVQEIKLTRNVSLHFSCSYAFKYPGKISFRATDTPKYQASKVEMSVYVSILQNPFP